MIDYATFCKIRALSQEGLKAQQIAPEVALNFKTVQRWINKETFTQRKASERSSLLDPHKATIVRLLQHQKHQKLVS